MKIKLCKKGKNNGLIKNMNKIEKTIKKIRIIIKI